MQRRGRAWSAALLAGWLPAVAGAITIGFEAIDLDDGLGPGGDYWEYQYAVSDHVFAENTGFAIAFDPDLYSDLQDPPPFVNADWDILVLQPDPGIPDDGVYDALALVDEASLADMFTLRFVWLGVGSPGSQAFSVNEYDEQGFFVQTLASGTTTPIPEPVTGSLLAFGLALLAASRSAWASGK